MWDMFITQIINMRIAQVMVALSRHAEIMLTKCKASILAAIVDTQVTYQTCWIGKPKRDHTIRRDGMLSMLYPSLTLINTAQYTCTLTSLKSSAPINP